jgi:hypothetical protein
VSEDEGAMGLKLKYFRVHLRLCLCVGRAGALVAVPATNMKGGVLVDFEAAGATSLKGIGPFRTSVVVGAWVGCEAAGATSTKGITPFRTSVVVGAPAGFEAAGATSRKGITPFRGSVGVEALIGFEAAGATSMNGITPFRGSVGVGAHAGFEAVELGELGLESPGPSCPTSGGAGSVASAGVAAALEPFEFNSKLLGVLTRC